MNGHQSTVTPWKRHDHGWKIETEPWWMFNLSTRIQIHKASIRFHAWNHYLQTFHAFMLAVWNCVRQLRMFSYLIISFLFMCFGFVLSFGDVLVVGRVMWGLPCLTCGLPPNFQLKDFSFQLLQTMFAVWNRVRHFRMWYQFFLRTCSSGFCQ